MLAGSPLAELIDTADLARATSAAFIGRELFEGVDDLGPVARRTLRAKLRRRDQR